LTTGGSTGRVFGVVPANPLLYCGPELCRLRQQLFHFSVAGDRGEVVIDLVLLAPARNDRRSAGKTTAGSAGLSVSGHVDYSVGRNLPGTRELQDPQPIGLQRGYPPHAFREHTRHGGRRVLMAG
jgi:hypothetical protein